MRLVINITLKTKNSGRQVKVLVDLGVKVNYVKRRLTLEIDILLLNKGVILLILLDRKRIYLYRDYVFIIAAKDLLRD